MQKELWIQLKRINSIILNHEITIGKQMSQTTKLNFTKELKNIDAENIKQQSNTKSLTSLSNIHQEYE